jgi:5-methylcytosine-specific restriction endonuclease McrA
VEALALIVGLAVGFAAAVNRLRRPVLPRSRYISRRVKAVVYARDKGRCRSCGSRENICFDHVVPFSRGGENTVENLQLLCSPCNLRKGATMPPRWKRRRLNPGRSR